MKIKCQSCGEFFSADKKQEKIIKYSVAKGMKMLMLSCGACGDTFPFRLDGKIDGNVDSPLQYRCPTRACTGYVSDIKDIAKYSYGCGECGSVWEGKCNLFLDIKAAIKKFPYRKDVYRIENVELVPVQPSKEPVDYEIKVRGEWDS